MKRNLIEQKFMQSLIWHQIATTGVKFAYFQDNGEFNFGECLELLSPAEAVKASELEDDSEIRHYVMRRVFQRCFIKAALSHEGPLADIQITHTRDAPPRCELAPDTSLSFSSSGALAIAAASSNAKIGVDIEIIRSVPNAIDIAKRFFTESEINHLVSLPKKTCETEFLKMWTIKEACLKAAGKGIVYGLEKFTIGANYHIEPPPEFGKTENWSLAFPAINQTYLVTVAIFESNSWWTSRKRL